MYNNRRSQHRWAWLASEWGGYNLLYIIGEPHKTGR